MISIPIVWAVYPESNQRTLEEMDLVFSCDSIWARNAEKHFAKLMDENADVEQAAKAMDVKLVPEAGVESKRDETGTPDLHIETAAGK